ncbi:hypothetical protein Ddye_022410 [Dipteronia dyeriana]|uniref:Uncharacterized protein n=1 Tax=Dipteronia dyeriana TaxID=168575 RepID=A0AAD9U4D9_9ROSI|nr:hypothetical protein Ddye_022410 [Dipteronia dyeriana]
MELAREIRGLMCHCNIKEYWRKLLALLFLLLVHTQPCKAGRVLGNKELVGLQLQSLQKAPVTPPGSSGCTFIPGSGGSGCPIEEMNFAGDHLPRDSRAYPRLMVPFGVATGDHKKLLLDSES